MNALPDTMRIAHPVRNDFFLIFGCLAFVLLARFALEDAFWLQMAVYIFFGGGLVVAILHMVVTWSNPDYVELDRTGWTTRTFLRTQRYKWTECSAFEIYKIRGRGGIVVNRMPICRDLRSTAPRSLLGYATQIFLPRLYGRISPGSGYTMPAEELTDLMNRYRDAALGAAEAAS